MSGGKGGTTTQSSTVSIPPEVLARYNAVNARAEQVAQQPFTPYGGQFVAPLTQTQQAGIANVNQAAGAAQPYYSAAGTALLGGAAQAQPYYQAATQGLYGGQAVAAPLQQAAAANIYGAQAGAQPYQALATGYGLAGARQVAPGGLNVGAYMSPYTEAVAQPTYQALRQQQEQERQRILGEQIRGGAFGGDRGKIAQATLAQQQNLATAQALGNIYQQGYGQALGAAQQQQGVALAAEQANRQAQQQAAQQFLGIGQQGFGQGMTAAQQQAALAQQLYGQGATTAQQAAALGQGLYGIGAGVSQGLAGLGAGAQQAAIQGGQAQLGAGQIEQQTQQAQNQALYNQFLQQQGYPFQVAQFLANIAMGTGALSGSTTQATTTQPTSFFSDERLKHGIEPIGKTYDGQEIVRFKYKGEPGTRIGLVAQDVEHKHPEAVGLAGGFKTVDYERATDDAANRGHFARGGLAYQSEGGAVHPESAGLGFADGGGADYNRALAELLTSHQNMFPYGRQGLYGSSSGRGGPYGITLSNPQARQLMQARLVEAKPQPSTAQSLESGVRSAENIQRAYGVGKGLGSAAESALFGSPGQANATGNLQGRTQGLVGAGGTSSQPGAIESGINYLRNLVSGSSEPSAMPAPVTVENLPPIESARGGAIRQGLAVGGLPYSEAEDEYVPEDLSKPITPQTLQPAQLSQPSKQKSGFESTLDMAKTAAMIYGMTGSDRRMKDNIEPIGKLFDGQQVYRYNYKGEPEKQIGLMAQDVEKKHPEAVGLVAFTKRHGYERGGNPDVPEEWLPVLEGASRSSGIPSHLLSAVGAVESDYGRNPRGRDNPMQIIESTARDPGYGVQPLALEDRARIDAAIPWAANYIAARNPNVDWSNLSRPEIARRISETYNAGGDPNYAERLIRRLPGVTEEEIAAVRAANAQGTSGGLAGQAQPPGSYGAPPSYLTQLAVRYLQPPQREERDWMQRNQSWLVPILSGLGAMAASPSRYLGSAVLQGLGAGAQTYAGMQAGAEERQRMQEQTAVQRAQAVGQLQHTNVQETQQLLEMLRQMPTQYQIINRRNPTTGQMETVYRDPAGNIVSTDEFNRRMAGVANAVYGRLNLPSPYTAPGTAGTGTTPPAAGAAPSAAGTAPPPPAGTGAAAGAPPAAPRGGPEGAAGPGPAVAPTGAGTPAAAASPATLPPPQTPQGETIQWSQIEPNDNPYLLADRIRALNEEAEYRRAQGQDPSNLVNEALALTTKRSEILTGRLPMSRTDRGAPIYYYAEQAAAQAARRAELEEEARTRGRIGVEEEVAPYVDPTTGATIRPPLRPRAAPEATAPAPATAPAAGPSTAPGAATEPPGAAPSAAPTAAPARNRASVESNSTRVNSVIPPAPRGGGYITPNVPEGSRVSSIGPIAEAQIERDRAMTRGLSSGPEVEDAITRYMAMTRALQLFQSGAGANATGLVARYAQSLGLDAIASGIAGGQISAQEWLEKEGVQTALAQLAAANSRFANAEYQVIRTIGMPDPTKTPQANMQVLVGGLTPLLRERKFQNDWNEAQRNGWTSPSAFYDAWSQANPKEVFQSAARRMIGNLRGMPLPSNPTQEWVPGNVYVLPPNPSRQLMNSLGLPSRLPSGSLFRYNGPDQPVTVLRPEEAFAVGAP